MGRTQQELPQEISALRNGAIMDSAKSIAMGLSAVPAHSCDSG